MPYIAFLIAKEIVEILSQTLSLNFYLGSDDYFNAKNKRNAKLSMTGWVRLHFKVVPETVRDRLSFVVNLYRRRRVPLSRWGGDCDFFMVKV